MPSVLFVCRANQFRSPLAAAFLKEFVHGTNARGNWSIESAGTWTQSGLPAAAVTLQIAHRLGLPGLEDHRTRAVTRELLQDFDLVLVMETGQREAIASEFPDVQRHVELLGEVVDGIAYSIEDATGQGKGPEEVAAELRALIQRGGQKILGLAEMLYRKPLSRQESES